MLKKIFFLVLLFVKISSAQQSFRFKADVTIKDKLSNGQYRLTIGSIYYDKLYKKIVYKLKFPKLETMVVQDTTLYVINSNNIITSASRTALIPEFTAFHLALTNQLSDYGLKPKNNEKPLYKIVKIEKNDKGTLATWTPAEAKLKKYLGDIKMQTIQKRLDAMVFYSPKGKIISKQFFKKYVNIKGVEFPSEVTMMSFGDKGEENLQLTTYKNIIIDQTNEDEIYHYKLPIRKSVGVKK